MIAIFYKIMFLQKDIYLGTSKENSKKINKIGIVTINQQNFTQQIFFTLFIHAGVINILKDLKL